uniref:Small ribosomal subunit protein bS18m n=1 Tax=Crocodylus porosus TaxID=8502 RepID=A0A7M4FBB7_CROPO
SGPGPAASATLAEGRDRGAGLVLFSLTPGALWQRRRCSRQGPVTRTEDLPIQMENPYKEPPKKCVLCGIHVNYKNVQLLSQFVSPYTGRMHGRHITGLCDKKQKEISKGIKRAQALGFMPVVYKDPSFRNDPKLCNIKYPE